ncbi:hypothetical protein B0A48_07040 [Cryoendolithus antarcticus]|uniref:Uncharacterized protein n=1 Tax=Cryoendolithus antarcticus TaxID=1507870 RepID=A0A1V8T7F2_9PEZI|nr:hypothetical protein B0A48_07040 [Cryoendolithus antarcticus]
MSARADHERLSELPKDLPKVSRTRELMDWYTTAGQMAGGLAFKSLIECGTTQEALEATALGLALALNRGLTRALAERQSARQRTSMSGGREDLVGISLPTYVRPDWVDHITQTQTGSGEDALTLDALSHSPNPVRKLIRGAQTMDVLRLVLMLGCWVTCSLATLAWSLLILYTPGHAGVLGRLGLASVQH